MTFELPPALGLSGDEAAGRRLLERIWGKRGIFTCTVANTLTSTIPGISEAGDTPELTMFTPVADAELLVLNRVVCMKGLPINPGGIPTPATLTKAALDLSRMPMLVIDGGCRTKPNIPCIEVGGECGDKVTTGHAVKNVRQAFEYGKILGKELARTHDYVVISESVAGGTTTALAVMLAMGTIRENLMSSSSPNNPKQFKMDTVMTGLKAAGLQIGDLANDPLKAIECVGDPMQPVNAGIILGAAPHVPVIVGGGTQMAAVLAVALKLDPSVEGNVIQGTTRWLMSDRNASMPALMAKVSPRIPIVYINMDYADSPYEGLQAYEWGYIKEGVGCGGAAVAAVISSAGRITCPMLLDQVHAVYRDIMHCE
ncbi:MAG: TIGR00303 family protein [Candidatus Methanomethylophilus sp.]|nr:TIGR00303 family protein [Methanomethylophilus sp.]